MNAVIIVILFRYQQISFKIYILHIHSKPQHVLVVSHIQILPYLNNFISQFIILIRIYKSHPQIWLSIDKKKLQLRKGGLHGIRDEHMVAAYVSIEG